MSFYDKFVYLDKKTNTGIRMKGWFWQEGFPLDQPDKYEKSFSTTSVEKAKEKLKEYAESQVSDKKEKADPELQDQPDLSEKGQMSLFS